VKKTFKRKKEGRERKVKGKTCNLVWDLFVNFHINLIIVLELLPIKLSYRTWDSCSVLSISIGIFFVTQRIKPSICEK
jgi:hypothetical protein